MKKIVIAKNKKRSENKETRRAAVKMTLIRGYAHPTDKWNLREENESTMLYEPEFLTKKERLKLSKLMLTQLRNFLHDSKMGN